jgi:hypothetical protein
VIRPFQRSDREQLTALVNAHIAAVVPGLSVSVNALLSQLEREPAEIVVDPWVVERETLVAIERDQVVAGMHVLTYADEERVGAGYRGKREIRWLVSRPDAAPAGAELIERSGAHVADCSLPGPFVYGVPDVWPHIRSLYAAAGFVPARVELVLVADVEDLPDAPLVDLRLRRTLGNWTRLAAGDSYIELETDFTAGGTLSRYAGWADVGNLVFDEPDVGVWLLAQAKDWLRLGRVDRLVAYASPGEERFYLANGFRELVRTERGWLRAG